MYAQIHSVRQNKVLECWNAVKSQTDSFHALEVRRTQCVCAWLKVQQLEFGFGERQLQGTLLF